MTKTTIQQNGWREVKLGDNHIDLISGFAFRSKNFLLHQEKGSLPVIKIKNVANGDVNFEKVVFHFFNKSLEKYKLSQGNILIAMTGNHPEAMTQVVGGVAKYKLKTEALLNQRVGRIITKGNNNLEFFYYFFKNKETQRHLADKSSGSANQANISKDDILGLEMSIPEPIEQKAIAEVLSSLDEKIDLLHRQNKTLEDMAQALFRKWFMEEPKDDWEEKPLDKIVKILSGFAFKSSNFVEAGLYRLVTIKNVQDGYIDLSRFSTLKTIPQKMPDYCQLKIGDILLSLTGNVGRCCLVTDKNLLLNQRVAKLKPKNIRDRSFIYFYLRQPSTKNNLEQMARGTAQLNLSPVETGKMIIKMPPEQLFVKFADSANDYLDRILHNYSQIQALEQMRDTLLPKLMSGEVRLKDFS